jgi:integrase/recombinase XerD
MMSFERYLIGQGYTAKTVKRYRSWEREFKRYFKNQQLEQLTYNELLSYFREKQEQGLTRSTLVHILARIKRYYAYLGVDNPLENFRLRGYQEIKQQRYLSGETLEDLMSKSQALTTWQQVLVSLLVYQGLAVEELAQLRIQDINLQSSVINVPASNLAARQLDLQARQLLPLIGYTQGKAPLSKLFPKLGKKRVSSYYPTIRKQLGHSFEPSTIRRSRIRLWIEEAGLLAAQYRAGHRSIVTTQDYQRAESEVLRSLFENLHPLF